MTKNDELLKVQENWKVQCYEVLKKEYVNNEEEKGKLSCAFGFGVSEHYVQSDKKIMIVGQEANGHTFDYEKWCLKNWREWAIDYLNFQVYNEKSKCKMEYNSSPFWQFFREFKNNGYGVCWNNLDKVRRYTLPDGKEWVESKLPYDENNSERKILNGEIFDGKSLLQKEIEIANPDCVIFAVGPKDPYYHTLCNAFFHHDGAYNMLLRDKNYPNDKPYPTLDYPVVEISKKLGLKIPVFYTYHPNFLRIKGKFEEAVEYIMNELNKDK